MIHHRGGPKRNIQEILGGYNLENSHFEVIFFDADGHQITRFVTKHTGVGCDLSVGILNEPVPENHKFYKVLPPADRNGTPYNWNVLLQGARTLNTTRERECVLYNVKSTGPSCQVEYGVLPSVPAEYRVPSDIFPPGNSSNPQFLFVKGEPILLGTLYASKNPGFGPFFSALYLFNEINAAMEDLGGNEQLTKIKLSN